MRAEGAGSGRPTVAYRPGVIGKAHKAALVSDSTGIEYNTRDFGDFKTTMKYVAGKNVLLEAPAAGVSSRSKDRKSVV